MGLLHWHSSVLRLKLWSVTVCIVTCDIAKLGIRMWDEPRRTRYQPYYHHMTVRREEEVAASLQTSHSFHRFLLACAKMLKNTSLTHSLMAMATTAGCCLVLYLHILPKSPAYLVPSEDHPGRLV